VDPRERREDGDHRAQLQATLAALAAGNPVCAGSGHSLLFVA
jgi:hypothetical protein